MIADVRVSDRHGRGPAVWLRTCSAAIPAMILLAACSSSSAKTPTTAAPAAPDTSAAGRAISTGVEACPIEVLAAANVMIVAGRAAKDPKDSNDLAIAALDMDTRPSLVVSGISRSLGAAVLAGRPLHAGDLASEAARQCSLQHNPWLPLDEVQNLADDPKSGEKSRLSRITYSG